jgi:CheY-like chemotaxis protein
MQRHAPRHTTRRPVRPANRIPTVCVVDPKADDYQGWDELAEAKGAKLKIVASAEEALRLARTATVDLWVVNTELPGLSGCELCSMLKSRSSSTPMYLVADRYTPEAERAAWQARATLFGDKPAHRDWLDHFVNSVVNPIVNLS